MGKSRIATFIAVFMAVLSLASCGEAFAQRVSTGTATTESIWLRMHKKSRAGYQYLDISKDGQIINRVEFKSMVVTRKGSVPAGLAKDLFQEVEHSYVFDSISDAERIRQRNDQEELLEITAFVHGEIRTGYIQIKALGTGFKYALAEIKKSADRLPRWKDVSNFILSIPLNDADVREYEDTTKREIKSTYLEAFDIASMPVLSRSLVNPNRLIPIETKEADDAFKHFLSEHNIKGYREYFFLKTSRGLFRCELITPNR